ncbi:hypothetical protein [uncultured Kordia sp.]|uniref:hypothetical protein n=1 Tax=uncultured Kordia sp. TaxID=507699 RepID=UPI002605A513|nr:hypothetical protein [uncultured Kordia sp.]
MKFLLKLSLLALIFVTKVQAQDLDFDVIGYIEIDSKRIQKTKIKSIKEESDCYVDQEKPPFTFEDCQKTYKEKYDKNGNLVSLKVYDDGSLETTNTYEYENNRILRIKEDDGEDVEIKVYRYNLTGKLMIKEEYENKTLEKSTSYKYNSQGLLSEEIYKNLTSEGFGSNPYQKTIYKYNSKGQCTYKGEFNKAGVELDVRIYEYSNNGLTKIEKDKRDDTYVKQFEQTKDSRGNILERVSYDYNGNQEKRMVETYDANNNRLTYEEYDSNDKFVRRTTETYNKYNDPKEYISFYPKNHSKTEGSKRITKYWYQYDKKGNWTQRASREDGDEYFSYEIKRTISYY